MCVCVCVLKDFWFAHPTPIPPPVFGYYKQHFDESSFYGSFQICVIVSQEQIPSGGMPGKRTYKQYLTKYCWTALGKHIGQD